MAVTYGFYNSVNGDRKYDALQMSQIFDGIINDGIFYSVGNRFSVTPSSGMVISIGSGRAWFNHTWTYNDAAITLTVSTAPIGSLKRIDAVVIEVNENNRVNTIKMVNGTASSTPGRPSLTNSGGIHQYAIAYITVDADVTSIASGKIASVVGTDTPFVTGPIQTVSVTSLYNYWETEFMEWFNNLEHVLDGDQALNLQNQINTINSTLSNKVNTSDFNSFKSDILHIGDIEYTTKPSLSNKWALCNGAGVSASTYPDLCKLLDDQQLITISNNTALIDVENSYSGINFLKYINSYYIAGGQYYDGSTTYARLWYTTSLTGTWSYINLWNYSGTGTDVAVYDLAYGNGRWVAVGRTRSGNYAIGQVWSSISLTSGWAAATNAWSRTATEEALTCVLYANSAWVVAGYTSSSANSGAGIVKIVYASDVTSSTTWSSAVTLWSDTYINTRPQCINYFSGTWVIGGSKSTSNSAAQAVIAYSTTLTSWTTKTLWTASNNRYGCVYSIKYLNSKYYACGVGNHATISTSGSYGAKIAYASSVSGSWTVKNVGGEEESVARDIEYVNGTWFLDCANNISGTTGDQIIYYGTNEAALTVPHTITNLIGRSWSGENVSFGICVVSNTLTFANRGGFVTMTSANSTFNCNLPTISSDVGYSFIRLTE